MSTQQIVFVLVVTVVGAAVGFVIGLMIGIPLATVIHEGAPVGVQSLSLTIGILMAVFSGSIAYYTTVGFLEHGEETTWSKKAKSQKPSVEELRPQVVRRDPATWGSTVYICQSCEKEYNESEWRESIECSECQAWFCSRLECLSRLSVSGKCPKCGASFSLTERERLVRDLENLKKGLPLG